MAQAKVKNENNETLKAGCVVVSNTSELLLVSGEDRRVWSFPKGHAEPGESAEAVAVREVFEETGLVVQVIRRLPDLVYMHAKTGEHIRVALFQARPLSFNVKPEPGIVAEWFTKEKARTALYENLVFVLDHVE